MSNFLGYFNLVDAFARKAELIDQDDFVLLVLKPLISLVKIDSPKIHKFVGTHFKHFLLARRLKGRMPGINPFDILSIKVL